MQKDYDKQLDDTKTKLADQFDKAILEYEKSLQAKFDKQKKAKEDELKRLQISSPNKVKPLNLEQEKEKLDQEYLQK